MNTLKLWFLDNKSLIKDILSLVAFIGILVLLRMYVFTVVSVSGPSMEPTLVDGERVISSFNKDAKRFDIVTFPPPSDASERYVKRVIGLSGDKVEYKNDMLYINDKEVSEPYLEEYKKNYGATADNPLTPDFTLEELYGVETVPEGYIFVLGDNRQVSNDSRYEDVGFIKQDSIDANLKFSIWPFKKVGFINSDIKTSNE